MNNINKKFVSLPINEDTNVTDSVLSVPYASTLCPEAQG